MPRNIDKQSEPDTKEIARKSLEMAGFKIGDIVYLPYLSPEKTWQIGLVTTTIYHGREVPSVLLQEKNTKDFITVTLHDLIINNPKEEAPLARLGNHFEEEMTVDCIGPNLTSGKFVYLRKLEEDGSETKLIFGQISNGPIEVGKVIESTLQKTTYIVTKITFKDERYIIETENGIIYIFDKTETLDALETE